MAVIQAGGGGGLFGNLLGLAANTIPGLQSVAPFINGARALGNGQVGSTSLAGLLGLGGGDTQVLSGGGNDSLFTALENAYLTGNGGGAAQQQGAYDVWPEYTSDPVTGGASTGRRPWGYR